MQNTFIIFSFRIYVLYFYFMQVVLTNGMYSGLAFSGVSEEPNFQLFTPDSVNFRNIFATVLVYRLESR